jgi:hypothetical protein
MLNAFICTVFLMFAAPPAGAQELPLLADELAEASAVAGAEGLRERFEEIWPEHKDEYDLDMQPVMALMMEAMQAGDMELVDALGEVNEALVKDSMERAMATMPPEVREQLEAADREREKELADGDRTGAAKAGERSASEQQGPQRGTPRNDLERFEGLYGDPAEPDSPRKLFVTRSCDGYLVVGAMWGDVAPWWMRSDDELRFSYADSFTSVKLTFLASGDGTIRTLEHDLSGLAQPLERQAPLPRDMFEECMKPPLR